MTPVAPSATIPTTSPDQDLDRDNGREIFRSAYENRYTWEHFPGYRAAVTLTQGDETFSGQVEIASDFSVKVTGIDQADVIKTLEYQLRDIVTHRQRNAFDKVHGENRFRLGETDATGAIEILVTGKSMGSAYKVRGREICHVQRNVGPMRFVINTLATLDTGSGYLPAVTEAQFFNGQTGDLTKEVRYEDSYTQVGDLFLMSGQTIVAREGDRETKTTLTFTNLQVLSPEP